MNYNNYPNGYANTFNNYPYQPNYTFGNQANNMNLNNNNYNSNYNSNYNNNNANNYNPNSINNIIWVQGETGAKSYLVAPNQSVELWDSESHTIYLKSADSNGIPTMKILDYKYRNTDKSGDAENEGIEASSNKFVNIDDFNQLKKDFDELKNKFDSFNNNSKKSYPKKRGDNKLC